MTMTVLLCLISILAGLGIITLLRLPLTSSVAFFLAPIMTLSFWILSLGWGISFGFTVKQLSYILWPLTAILIAFCHPEARFLCRRISMAGFGAYPWSFAALRMTVLFGMTALIILLPILTMMPYFSHGILNYIGSDAPDGWSYVAQGQYLWEHALGTHGGLSPLYQYAASLGKERFIGAALLSFLSPLTGHAGDTQQSTNLFLVWIIFVFTSSCAFFASCYQLKKLTPWYLTLVVFSGWILGMLAVNNFDNAIFISFLPVICGIIFIMTVDKLRWSIVLAALFSCVLYSFVQLSPFVLIAIILMFLQKGFSEAKENRYKLGMIVFFTLILSLVLTLPHLDQTLNSWKGLGVPAGIERPGEGYFRSLVQSHYFFAAFWGIRSKFIGECLGIILTLLALRGLFILWREKQFALVAITLLFLFAAIDMVLKEHYSYGAYKFLAMNSWLMFFAVIKGIENGWQKTQKFHVVFMSVFLALWLVYLGQGYTVQQAYARLVTIPDISPYKRLSYINSLTEGKAVLVDIDGLVANEWAVYFLRDIPIKIKQYRGYMLQEGALKYLHASSSVLNRQILFQLSDSRRVLDQKMLLWSTGPYYLFSR